LGNRRGSWVKLEVNLQTEQILGLHLNVNTAFLSCPIFFFFFFFSFCFVYVFFFFSEGCAVA